MANEPKIKLALVNEMPENPVRGTVYMSPDTSGNFVKVGVDGSVRTIFDGSNYVLKDESPWVPGEGMRSAVLIGMDSSHGKGHAAISHGEDTWAIEDFSHAEGSSTNASGYASHAEGVGSSAQSSYTVSGSANTKTYTASTAHGLGVGDIVSYNGVYAKVVSVSENTFTLNKTLSDASRLSAVNINIVRGVAYGDYSHAEGNYSTASGDYSHAEGHTTTASSSYSHAEGYKTTASGIASHAEGYETTASGVYSQAEGNYSTASGGYSHAEGYYTQATNDYEHAQGKYNISRERTLFSIGTGGNENNRKNIIEVNGNSLYIEQVGNFDGSTLDASTKTVAQVFNFKPLQDVYYDYIFNGGDMPILTKRLKVIYFDDYPDGIDYYANERGFEDSSSYIAACINDPFTYGVNVCWYMNDIVIDGVTHELYGIAAKEDNFSNRIPEAYGVLKTDSINYMTANSLETDLSNKYCPFVSVDFGSNEYLDDSGHFTLIAVHETIISDE